VGHTVSAIINNSIKLYYSNLGSSSSDTLHYITFICLVPGLQQPGVAWQYKTVAVISCKLLINYYIESLHHHCPPPPDPLHLLSVLHLSLLIKYQSFVSPWLFFPLQRLHTYRISSISDLHLNLIFQGSFYYFIGSGSFKIIENGIIWEIAYEFLFIFHCIYGHILYCFRNKARHLLQNAYFSKLPSI